MYILIDAGRRPLIALSKNIGRPIPRNRKKRAKKYFRSKKGKE